MHSPALVLAAPHRGRFTCVPTGQVIDEVCFKGSWNSALENPRIEMGQRGCVPLRECLGPRVEQRTYKQLGRAVVGVLVDLIRGTLEPDLVRPLSRVLIS